MFRREGVLNLDGLLRMIFMIPIGTREEGFRLLVQTHIYYDLRLGDAEITDVTS